MAETTACDRWPADGWETVAPEEVGIKSDILAELDAYARDSMPPIRGILIVRHGRVAFERYYIGCSAETYHSVNSITKSVLSALVGIAFRRGFLATVELPLVEVFPELANVDDDPRKQTLTLRHLLTMTGGFTTAGLNQPLQANMPLDVPNLIEWAFARPLDATPGERFQYDDLSCHLVSVLLSRLTGMSAAAFAEQELFARLGIWTSEHVRFVWQSDRSKSDGYHIYGRWPEDGRPWKVDQHGNSIGSLGLHLTLREVATFGGLYLNRGRWGGDEIVPAWFVRDSTRAQNPGAARVAPGDCSYGYLWWVHSPSFYFGLGYGGQYLHVDPPNELVVAVATTIPRNVPQAIFPRFIRPALLS